MEEIFYIKDVGDTIQDTLILPPSRKEEVIELFTKLNLNRILQEKKKVFLKDGILCIVNYGKNRDIAGRETYEIILLPNILENPNPQKVLDKVHKEFNFPHSLVIEAQKEINKAKITQYVFKFLALLIFLILISIIIKLVTIGG